MAGTEGSVTKNLGIRNPNWNPKIQFAIQKSTIKSRNPIWNTVSCENGVPLTLGSWAPHFLGIWGPGSPYFQENGGLGPPFSWKYKEAFVKMGTSCMLTVFPGVWGVSAWQTISPRVQRTSVWQIFSSQPLTDLSRKSHSERKNTDESTSYVTATYKRAGAFYLILNTKVINNPKFCSQFSESYVATLI